MDMMAQPPGAFRMFQCRGPITEAQGASGGMAGLSGGELDSAQPGQIAVATNARSVGVADELVGFPAGGADQAHA
jgi:hypothetical protein